MLPALAVVQSVSAGMRGTQAVSMEPEATGRSQARTCNGVPILLSAGAAYCGHEARSLVASALALCFALGSLGCRAPRNT
jgi:hypothetical protein